MQTPLFLLLVLIAALFTACSKSDGNEVAAKDFFMSGTYDGKKFDCTLVNPIVGGGRITIQGITASGQNILIKVHAEAAGSYNFGDESIAGKAFMGYTDNSGNPGTHTNYATCGPPVVIGYSGGSVSIKSFGISGGIIAGTFQATLYDDRNCELVSKEIKGEFRTRRL
ncbi:DUF6252 family protein [uncultured Chitinophaga sp.]|uniref:DUF6252 family protein n=1 Tax=uncultured Chitinophaga sp. TaxID=339340 RepID=UPI0025F19491|nr:DUF6252 family protein [uncultured Chitinophaga sp.]